MDVTPYTFQKINSTWGTSHQDNKLRKLEEIALSHTGKVARESYKLNKTLDTQTYVQKYITDEVNFQKELEDIVSNDRKVKKNGSQEAIADNRYKRYKELKESKDKADNNLNFITAKQV